MAIIRIDSYYYEVGRVASAWAGLEFTMDYLIWQLAKVDQRAGTCITSQLAGARARLRCIIALLHLRKIPEVTVKKFRSFEGEYMSPLLEKRNRIVHDTWAYDARSQVVQLRLAITKQRLDFGLTPIPIGDVIKTHDEITNAEAIFRAIISDVFAIFPPSSPGISPYIPPQTPSDQPALPEGPNEP